MKFRMPPEPERALEELEGFSPVAYRALDHGCQGAALFFRSVSPKRRRPRYDPDLHPHLVRFFAKLEFRRHRHDVQDESFAPAELRLNGLQLKQGRFNLRILKAFEGGLPPAGQSDARQRFYQQEMFTDQDSEAEWNLVVLWHLTPTYALDYLSLVCPKSAAPTDAAFWEIPIPHPATLVKSIPDPAAAAAEADDLEITYGLPEAKTSEKK